MEAPSITEHTTMADVENIFTSVIPDKYQQQVREELMNEISKSIEGIAKHRPPPILPPTPTQEGGDKKSDPTTVTDIKSIRTRAEIRSMSQADQQRFVDAVNTMMLKHGNGVEKTGQSEWFRLASYHGWPANDGQGFCSHRAENFPAWHRAYLLEFEAALSVADKLNGNDGNLGLPYWDFAIYTLNDQVMPKIVRDHFGPTFKFPDGFFDGVAVSTAADFVTDQFRFLASDERLLFDLQRAKVSENAYASLDQEVNHEHWLHASTETSRNWPFRANNSVAVETSHNMTHVALGFPLTSLSFAAFHPMFYLLHCNVDRIYESYVQSAPGRADECRMEMKAHQQLLQGRTDLYNEALTPFKTLDGHYYKPEQLFQASLLGYNYTKLPKPPSPQLRVMPTLVVFKAVDVVYQLIASDGRMKSLKLHSFLIPKSLEATTKTQLIQSIDALVNNGEGTMTLYSHPNYAGLVGAFGGKGPKCKNCAETTPINLVCDVSTTMKQLGISSRYDCEVKVLVEDEKSVFTTLELLQDTFGPKVYIPQPILIGPLFEDADTTAPILRRDDVTGDAQSIQLQLLLKKLGLYDGVVDGNFGAKTELALKEYQEITGLLVDGVAGPVTKGQFTQSLHDSHTFATSASTNNSDTDKAVFESNSTIPYYVGSVPGYLNSTHVRLCIGKALTEWQRYSNLQFILTETVETAKLHFVFGMRDAATITNDSVVNTSANDDGDMLQFDGPGGELARVSNGVIQFDPSERFVGVVASCLLSFD